MGKSKPKNVEALRDAAAARAADPQKKVRAERARIEQVRQDLKELRKSK